MRKITQQAVNAFINNEAFSASNTRVSVTDKTTTMLLHENVIAVKTIKSTKITLAGWPTTTTKERLNGLGTVYGFKIFQKAHNQYIDLDGETTQMSEDSFYHIA